MVSLNGSTGSCTVAVDAMGGDHAPDEVLLGAAEAVRRGASVILVGPRTLLLERLEALKLPSMPIAEAPDVIGMNDGIRQLRHKDKSTLHVAARLVNEGEADAFVSAGNSAAIMAIALLVSGRQAGIERPAFGGVLPTKGSDVFILDIGANPEVKPSNLVQFAVMGEVYVRLARGVAEPRIALLSNGTENSKGTDEVKEANDHLRKLDLNFVGNIEGNHVFDGTADVVVCDGFAGNVLLKGVEGAGSFLFELVRAEVSRDLWGRVAAAALMPAFNRIRRRVDYQEYGGAPVMGVNDVVVNLHGRSKARAITIGIEQAAKMAREGLVQRIGEALQAEAVETARRSRLARALHLRSDRG